MCRRKKKAYGSEVDSVVTNARSKVNCGNNALNNMRRSQSVSVSEREKVVGRKREGGREGE